MRIKINEREKWKLITHIDNKPYKFACDYYISNYGRIKSNSHGNLKVLKLQINKGYYCIELRIRDDQNAIKRKIVQINRIVCEYFCEYDVWKSIVDGGIVNHIDCDKLNNFYKNLELVTQKYNMLHALNNGLLKIGEDTYNSVITEREANIICTMIEDGYTSKYIANSLDIKHHIVKNIMKGETWKHISKNYSFPNKKSTMTFEDVNKICSLLSNGHGSSQISRILNINVCVIHDIKRRKTWKNISHKYDF